MFGIGFKIFVHTDAPGRYSLEIQIQPVTVDPLNARWISTSCSLFSTSADLHLRRNWKSPAMKVASGPWIGRVWSLKYVPYNN